MTKVQNTIRSLTVLGMFVTTVQGAGLESLAQRAYAFVTGSVAARIERNEQIEFTINIDRVLAGVVPEPSVHVVHGNWASLLLGPAPRTLNNRLYGMWFLVKGSSNTWDVIPARPSAFRTVHNLYLPSLPAPLTSGPFSYREGTRLEDALVFEVAAAIVAEKVDPEVMLGALDSLDGVAVRQVLRTFVTSGDPDLQIIGLAGSLERQVAGSLEFVDTEIVRLSGHRHKGYVGSALKYDWRDTAPEAVRQLASQARRFSDPDLRSAAVWALAGIHSREALPGLASFLYSSDAEEQSQAMYGLSAFVNGCPAKTRANAVSMAYLQCDGSTPYKNALTIEKLVFSRGSTDQQAPALAFWRTWWDEHQDLH